VRPPADPQAAAVLAELRQLNYVIRTAELNGQRDPASIARRGELQREIRERSWHAGGFGTAAAPARLDEVQAALAESGQRLVAILSRDGRLVACVLRGNSVRLVRLGDAKAAVEAAQRLSADLDTLAGRRLPDRLDAVVRDSVRQQTEILNTEIIAPLRDWTGDGGLVLNPPGALAGVPWSLLPDLRDRPLTVCPSASVWLAARQRQAAAGGGGAADSAARDSKARDGAARDGAARDHAARDHAARDHAGPVAVRVLVAGPDLLHAEQEIAQIAQIYPGSHQLTGKEATVDAALRALDGAPLAHLAAHGHHDLGNVLFSRLDLADGPLMAYDVQGLTSAPRHVVLSSCDVGRTVVRPGEEVLGFSAALLYAGTATVIASVARVADDASVRLMTAYHRALQAGDRPAEALARSALAEPLSPFICFGSG
jgi:CHAT domain-containing protein